MKVSKQAVGFFSPETLPDPPIGHCADGSVWWIDAGRLVVITGERAEFIWENCQRYLCSPDWHRFGDDLPFTTKRGKRMAGK